MSFAEKTSVSVERSQAEIQQTLRRYGVTEFAVMSGAVSSAVAFTIGGTARMSVKMEVAMPDPKADEFRFITRRGYKARRADDAALAAWEQACRSRWRALLLCIKAKLEAVAAGISTMEIEFMAFIVCDNGQVLHERLLPQITEAASNGCKPSRLQLTM